MNEVSALKVGLEMVTQSEFDNLTKLTNLAFSFFSSSMYKSCVSFIAFPFVRFGYHLLGGKR